MRRSHCRAAWSVLIRNFRLKRYCLKYFVKNTTAKSSFRVVQYWDSALLYKRLPKAITFSSLSWTLLRTAPIDQPLASVPRRYSPSSRGSDTTGAAVSLLLSSSKASWHSAIHSKRAFFLVRACNGRAIKLRSSQRVQRRVYSR